jgi:ankyrin repeat protein
MLLLEREDTDINLPDNFGWTPLHWACKEVNLLLEKDNISVNAR